MNPLSKHKNFLLSAGIRNLSPFQIASLTESECHDFFAKGRFGDLLKFACPGCGVIDKHYYRSSRRQWRCKHCDTNFSCTSGTAFADRKLPFKKIMLGFTYFINAANGVSAIRMAHDIDVQVKTANVMIGKIRESLARSQEVSPLSGTVELDGGHFGGRPRSGRVRWKSSPEAIASKAKAVVDHQNGFGPKPRAKASISKANFRRLKKRRIVFVMRQHSGRKGFGADRTLAFVIRSEVAKEVTPFINGLVVPGSTIMTDESGAYTKLSTDFIHRTVNHQVEFSSKEGYNENQAESYFSRLRRYFFGVSHKCEPKYAFHKTAEMAWREDMRRSTQLEKMQSLLKSIGATGRSVVWRGYWQGIAAHTTEKMVLKSSRFFH